MNAILSLIGPYVIKLVSSTAVKAAALAVVKVVLDRVEAKLQAAGRPIAADVLQAIEAELVADPTPLVAAVEGAVAANPTVAARTT